MAKVAAKAKKTPAKSSAMPSKAGSGAKTASKTSTATRTATATKTSTDAYTQGNITVTGGAGAGPTSVTIGIPGGSLKNNSKKAETAKASAKRKVKK